MRNITLSADDALIHRAREKALREDVTLNALFRQWLRRYVGQETRAERYRGLMDEIAHVDAGRTFSRDDLNER